MCRTIKILLEVGLEQYYIADHLGNSRVCFTDKDGNGVIDITGNSETNEVLEESHFYPFGMRMEGNFSQNAGRENNYLYNGKELDTDFGLNWYHYGARIYDPAIGRFTGVDPISDRFAHLSTYNYASNDPIKNIDLHGLQGLHYTKKDDNGNTSHVIERNVVVLTKKLKSVPSGARKGKKRRIEKTNRNRSRKNQNKLETVKEELNFLNEGNPQNTAGESVEFKFNIIPLPVEDDTGNDLNISRTAYDFGLTSAEEDGIGGKKVVKASIMSNLGGGNESETRGDLIKNPRPNSPEGTRAHEMAHHLLLTHPDGNGIMNRPPRNVTREEIDIIIRRSLEKN